MAQTDRPHSASSPVPPLRALPPRARAYVAAVSIAAMGAVVAASVLGPGPELDPALLALALALCAGASLLEVFAPGHRSLQPSLVFFFCGALLLPSWAIAVVAVACFLPACLKHGLRWYMAAFNAASYAAAGIAAHELVRRGGALAEGGGAPSLGGVLALVLAALVFVVLNAGLIVLVASLARRCTLREGAAEMAPSLTLDAALAMTGACLAVLWHYAPALALVATGPMVLAYKALWVPLLEHKSRTDPKTGLANAEHLYAVFTEALALATKRDASLSVVMIDVDRLRDVNNGRGHLAGDRLLQATSREVLEVAGPGDTAARFGGDELCLLLPGKSLAAARRLVEELRSNVELLTVPSDDGGPPLQTTISAGIASYPEHGTSVKALLSAADAAVYDAKLGGRNRVGTAVPRGTREALGWNGVRGEQARPDEEAPPPARRIAADGPPPRRPVQVVR